jgi:hypothetical protein
MRRVRLYRCHRVRLGQPLPRAWRLRYLPCHEHRLRFLRNDPGSLTPPPIDREGLAFRRPDGPRRSTRCRRLFQSAWRWPIRPASRHRSSRVLASADVAVTPAEQEVSMETPFYSTSNSTPHAGCEDKRWRQDPPAAKMFISISMRMRPPLGRMLPISRG